MIDAATRLVLTAGLVYSYRFPFSTSVILDQGRIAWIGDDGGLSGQLLDSDVIVDCEGALIAPMFFDAMLPPLGHADPGVGAGFLQVGERLELRHKGADGQWSQYRHHSGPQQTHAFVDRGGLTQHDVDELLASRAFAVVHPHTEPTVLSALASSGVPFAYGSFSESGTPWQWLRNGVYSGPEGLSARAAFNAATRSGWRMAGLPEAGELAIGSDSSMCLWECEHLEVQVPDERVRAWSTDVRAGTPPLPDLRPDAQLPTLTATVIDGVFRKAD